MGMSVGIITVNIQLGMGIYCNTHTGSPIALFFCFYCGKQVTTWYRNLSVTFIYPQIVKRRAENER